MSIHFPLKLAYNGELLFCFYSALSSDADENGLRHILLCRVILGKRELVPPDSKQLHPSSNEFDSGVDSLRNPKRFIIWSSFMNSHIIPHFVVSFKAPASLNGEEFEPIFPTSVLVWLLYVKFMVSYKQRL